jgi:hypothetical protein
LATGKYGGDYLVFFGGTKDEYRVCRGLLQRFKESVEGLLAQHMHLIDYIYAVLAYLRRYLHLILQSADIVNAIVRGCIQFVDIVRTPFLERLTGIAFSARVQIRSGI